MASLFMQCLSVGFSLLFFIVLIILLQQYHLDNYHRLVNESAIDNSTDELDFDLDHMLTSSRES